MAAIAKPGAETSSEFHVGLGVQAPGASLLFPQVHYHEDESGSGASGTRTSVHIECWHPTMPASVVFKLGYVNSLFQ